MHWALSAMTGLALAGFTSYFLHDRIQIVGKTEHSYLLQLPEVKRIEAVERIVEFKFNCVILTKNLNLPSRISEILKQANIAVLRTSQDTTVFIQRLSGFLKEQLAERKSIHGTLVEVHGVGCLLTGESGIGKSECALDLITRGHRLIGDDVVELCRLDEDTPIGRRNDFLRHHMEIRGIGIIDVKTIFGLKSVRMDKRVDVDIYLSSEQPGDALPRINIEDEYIRYLDVEIPRVRIPVIPGKNISVLVEMVALHHLAKIHGIHPSMELSKKLVKMLNSNDEKPDDDAWISND